MRKIYLLLAVVPFVLSSCVQDNESLLDKEESNDIYENMVFSDPYNAIWFLNGVYAEMNKGFFVFGSDYTSHGGFLGNAVDEGMWKANWDNAYQMSVGAWNSTTDRMMYNPWNKYYKAIRSASRVIEHADEIPDSTEPLVNAQIRKRMKAEARFLRALFHYELLKFYGATPIVTKVLSPDDNAILHGVRPSYSEVVDFICDEATLAAQDLPNVDEYAVNDWGRATKGACDALICRVRLMAASPLFNDAENSEDTPWSQVYDANRWQVAAKAAADFIKTYRSVYSLHQSTDPSKYGDYEDLFLRRYSPEIILAYQNAQYNCPLERCCLPGQFYSYSFGVWNNFPTLNAVSEYEVVKLDASGHISSANLLGLDKVIEAYNTSTVDAESGFDPQNPYINRDPRFYQSIWYNNEAWPARGTTFKDINRFEFWNGGSIDGTAKGFFTTGFANRKFLDQWANLTGYGSKPSVTHNFILFRYAEILLNYAEAVNEAYGPDSDPFGVGMTPYDAINQVRRRAKYPSYDMIDEKWPVGMPKTAMGESLPDLPAGLSKSQMRERIVHERWVEFYQEEHRYFDLNRWKRRRELKIYKQIIEKNGNDFNYSISLLFTKPWNDKFYLFPIQESELQKSPETLVQNPGWSITEDGE